MTGKQRFSATLQGQNECLSAGIAYPEIPFRDRCEEHMEHPWWLLLEANPDKCIPAVRKYLELIGCDWWGQMWQEPLSERKNKIYLHEDSRDCILDTQTGLKTPIFIERDVNTSEINENLPQPSSCEISDEEYLERIEIIPAQEQIRNGMWDFPSLLCSELGKDYFLYSYTNVPFTISMVKGFSETLMLTVSDPQFLHRYAERYIEKQAEYFRAMKKSGFHGVWMQDMYSGSEILGREQYREIVLPHGRDLVSAAHNEGLIVIHYFLGNAGDRADLVAETGADVILFEEARKGYRVSLPELDELIKGEKPVFLGNLSAENVLACTDDDVFQEAVRSMVQYGKQRGKFLFGTGAPPTPATSLERIKSMTDSARRYWEE